MIDLEALHRAVLLDPWDDAPRLFYADALEDLEPDRAAFIRLGVGIARSQVHCYHDLTRPPDCPVCALHLQAAELSRKCSYA